MVLVVFVVVVALAVVLLAVAVVADPWMDNGRGRGREAGLRGRRLGETLRGAEGAESAGREDGFVGLRRERVRCSEDIL